ncbi:SDR family NAD(P)-dependent oxidoreductase [Nocardia pneumoniae]|uniref:SDR family NAD(P)-dependent oxidoreductase n=1 Tax=Nocardia pneumoniae TaxID=228601 RepID=UPI0002D2D332|nr:SDR family oxidoreductase [Nocardia pneumoniae]
MKLDQKVAVVTGASRGIGAATAAELAAHGATVVVNYQDERFRDEAESVASAITADGGRVHLVRADLRVAEQRQNLVDSAVRLAGRLDILVNNAAVYRRRSTENVDLGHLAEHFDTNVNGGILTTVAAAAQLSDGGRIIYISSGLARRIAATSTAYAATKAAVEAAARCQAAELGARGITVNAVAPGIVDTAQLDGTLTPPEREALIAVTSLGRIGQPRDIAKVVAFLASDDAGWITGQVIDVDGGLQ